MASIAGVVLSPYTNRPYPPAFQQFQQQQPTKQPQLSSVQSRFVYLFSGLAPVCVAAVTPLITYGHVKKQPAAILKSRLANEIGRQSMAGIITLISYFSGGELTKRLLQPLTPYLPTKWRTDKSSQHVIMLVGGVSLQFFASSYIRPLLSNQAIDFIENHWEQLCKIPKRISPLFLRKFSNTFFLKHPMIGSILLGSTLLVASCAASISWANKSTPNDRR